MAIAHQLHLKEPQIHKLMERKPVQISLAQMGADKGKHIIYLEKPNAKKLLSSYRKGKGIRLTLTPDELEKSIKEGSGLVRRRRRSSSSSSSDSEKSEKKSVGKGMKLVKGSQEAKDYMAKIRGKKGKGLGKDLGKMLGSAAGTALGAVGGPLGSAAGSAIGSAAGSALGGFAEKKITGKGAKMSAPYKQALKMNFDGLELPVRIATKKIVGKPDARVKASSEMMTLSPYQKTTSPAMNPFVPTTYVQEGGTSSGYGGKGMMGAGLYGPSGCGLSGGRVRKSLL
jgi:hypothetical protein